MVTLSCAMLNNNFINLINKNQSLLVIIGDEADAHPLVKSISEKLKVLKDDRIEFSSNEGINVLREKIRHFALKPNSGIKRLFIVFGADLMRREQANALLKTIEEPPSFGKIVLLAKNKTKILPTISSRCQQILYRSRQNNDRESIIPLIEKTSFGEYLHAINKLDKTTAIGLLEGGLEELRKRGLNKSKGQMFGRIGSSLSLLASTNCNHKLVLEGLYIFNRAIEK